MSVLLQVKLSPSAHHPLTEAAALHAISRVVSTAKNRDFGLKGIAASALRVPGVHKVQITPSVAFPPVGALEWYASNSPVLCGSAMAYVEAGGRSWGRLHLFFEPRIETVESPLRFARFLGQQVSILLNRFALNDQVDAQLAILDVLKTRLSTRIALHRAAGIIAELRGIEDQQALALLVQYARQSRRTLLSLADAVILGDTSFRKPFRPIPRNEPNSRTRLFA